MFVNANDSGPLLKSLNQGGTADDAPADTEGPLVEIFMNDETFVFGGLTDENPVLLLKLINIMNSDLERIKTLIDFDILDTSPEQMFDDITSVASYVCGMPIALISLLDRDKQFFKSNLGLNIRETPIEYSLCKMAIETPEDIFIIEDAREDDRFRNNPLVSDDPNIVSYYGVPLNSKTGVSYGTLCVMDTEVKILTNDQKDILKKLSRQVEHLIELRINNKLFLKNCKTILIVLI